MWDPVDKILDFYVACLFIAGAGAGLFLGWLIFG